MMHRRHDIDGLRGLAVVLVMFFHAGWLSGGFVGVDVFCVISGYYMSQTALMSASFSPWTFITHRLQRLLPALLFMVALVCAAMLWWLLPRDRADIAQNGMTALLYFSNLWAHEHAGYFAGQSLAYPFLHTWSLSVEMQFYLLILLLGMARQGWLALCLIGAGSLLSSQAGWGMGYYGLTDRLWQFALGGAIAYLPARQLARVPSSLLYAAAVAAIVACGFLYTNANASPSLWSIVPCLAAALIILLPESPAQRVLNTLSPVGLISYSLYLWHWPIIVGATYLFERQITGLSMVLALLVSLLMGVISYAFIEKRLSAVRLIAMNLGVAAALYGISIW
ncbi:acyltransferase family protein [[Enterobacter] lignolyticus]|uniref:Acyltransferase 3 n=1 Tax=Enterobacter lignolyticus (strain SCF1) TaxID=701347 RepID=E3G5V4_ENTLS|nr:acyltransferase [[Enterobacter] lignolyticus]ADO47239.1 acyltransferase 3 [[Enterobacter] lignolyticus SCF1]